MKAQLMGIPWIELYPKDFYPADEDRGRMPSLGNAFLDWYLITQKYEVLKNHEYKAWPLRLAIKERENSSKAGQTVYAAVLWKNQLVRAELDRLTTEGKLEDVLDKLVITGVLLHMPRLLTHVNAPACEAFVVACVQLFANYDREELRKLFPRSIDGTNAEIFYTIAPYLLAELAQSLELSEAFDRVLKWAQARQENIDGSNNVTALYPGFNSGGFDIRLAQDGQHYSHQLACRVARHITPYLL